LAQIPWYNRLEMRANASVLQFHFFGGAENAPADFIAATLASS
jgi:hypothetical protein